jgi:hypothetical protein
VFQVPKDESSATSSTTGIATPDDTSDKVRYEKSALRVSVVDKSSAYLSPEQKMASKKLYFSYYKLTDVDLWRWIESILIVLPEKKL